MTCVPFKGDLPTLILENGLSIWPVDPNCNQWNVSINGPKDEPFAPLHAVPFASELDAKGYAVTIEQWAIMQDEAREPQAEPKGGDLCTRCGNPIDHNDPHTYCQDCA